MHARLGQPPRGAPGTQSTSSRPVRLSWFARRLACAMVAVAQLVEHRVVVPGVGGSSPLSHPILTIARTGAVMDDAGAVSGDPEDGDHLSLSGDTDLGDE